MRLQKTTSRHSRCGMTLLEILAVVVILGLLASTLVVSFSGSFSKAKRELGRTGIGQIQQKLEIYHLEKDSWPSNEIGLRALSVGYASRSSSYYIDADKLIDPWGRPYYFVVPGPGDHFYEVLSYGADGVVGGEGKDADISSTDLRGLNL
ncbi:MAG: type II secretion system major pseudopilin GspG [Planctomycetota bacterium]